MNRHRFIDDFKRPMPLNAPVGRYICTLELPKGNRSFNGSFWASEVEVFAEHWDSVDIRYNTYDDYSEMYDEQIMASRDRYNVSQFGMEKEHFLKYYRRHE